MKHDKRLDNITINGQRGPAPAWFAERFWNYQAEQATEGITRAGASLSGTQPPEPVADGITRPQPAALERRTA